MKSLIFTDSALNSNLSRQFSIFRFPLDRNYCRILHVPRRKWPQNLVSQKFVLPGVCCGVESTSYGGWDDLRFAEGSVHPGDSAQLHRFLVSAGFDDKRYVLVFIVGFVSALAISRVRIPSIIIFPASVLVFAFGFSMGLFRGGIAGQVNGSKKRIKEDMLRFGGERLEVLVEFFNGIDARVNRIKNGLQKAIDCNGVSLGDLLEYVEELKLISSSTSKVRDAMHTSIGNNDDLLRENVKLSKDQKELGHVIFDFVGSLFGESASSLNANKNKNSVKQENVENVLKDHARGGVPSSDGEERGKYLSHKNNDNIGSDSYDFMSKRPTSIHEGGQDKGPRSGLRSGNTVLNDRGWISYQDNQTHFVNKEHTYTKASSSYQKRTWRSQNNLLDFTDDLNMKNIEAEASFEKEQWDKKSSETYTSWNRKERSYYDAHQHQHHGRDEKDKEDFLFVDDHLELEENNGSQSSTISDDIVFDRYLTEANSLLKRARDLVKTRSEADHAQTTLYKAAEILGRATAMKPMSLLAVGLLGNTYLLQGELKLRMSRDLRTLLLTNEPLSFERHVGSVNSLDYNPMRKDKIASALVGVCEECEELLVEAGRKYRHALSIDGNDARALYNWGLALSFRAQLIADIGPEAAYDADKVFLAAIDKFDMMMSKGNIYAPDGTF
ncbi:hypothetical protein SAY87_030537 [Trapa incisa]|uniref:Uncharacterized protein n=1 Tax=Trapa incisa TaxID=236973 RepID=A0AAN7KUE1_9MYRT|nr:hypothetical protein SAY87_030537 [Trapa incisa]